MPGPDALGDLDDGALVSAIADWARAASAAEARELAGIAELVRRRGVAEHPDWACDDWDACAAEVSCALTVGHRRASWLMDLAVTLRDRLPKIGALFMAGELPTRTVQTIARRTFWSPTPPRWPLWTARSPPTRSGGGRCRRTKWTTPSTLPSIPTIPARCTAPG